MDDFLSIGLGFAAEKPIGDVVVEKPDLVNPVAESHDRVQQCIQCEDKFKKTLEPFDKKIDEQKEKYAAKCEIVNSCEPCRSDKEREDEISTECLREGTDPSRRLYSAEQYIIDQVMTSDLVNAQKNTIRAFANGINILTESLEQVSKINDGVVELKDADIVFDKYSQPDSNVTVLVENSYLTHIPFEEIEDSIIKIMDAATFISRNSPSSWVSAISDLGDNINTYIDKFIPYWNIDVETASARIYEHIDSAIKIVAPTATRVFERAFYNIQNFAGDTRVSRNIREVVSDYEDIRKFVGFIENIRISIASKKDAILGVLKDEATLNASDVTVESNERYMKVLTLIYNLFKCISGFIYTMTIDYESVIKAFKPIAIIKSSENLKKKLRSTEAIVWFDGKEAIISNVRKLNPFVTGDYHLLREFHDGLAQLDKTLKIIEMHNKCVKPNDWFLFVGDISEQEYFDQNNSRYLNMLLKYWNMLNGKKILIKGNNDTGSNEFYKKLGFYEIYDYSVKINDLLFSHAPCGKLPPDVSLNIHGHIHGSCQYCGMSKDKMIDCFYGLFGKVLRLNELIDYYKSGQYHGINVTDKPMESNALIPILDLSN